MIFNIVFLVAGLTLLYFGAEWMVKGAANVAERLGVPPAVVGLTVVALGTSLPELVASVMAALKGAPGIALGNVIGSNVANIGLALGVGALIWPITIDRRILKQELPVMLLFTLAVPVLLWDGWLSRIDGALLLGGALLYNVLLVMQVRRGGDRVEGEVATEEVAELIDHAAPLWREVALTVVGMAGVIGGAALTVEGGVNVARDFGISELVIGVTVVAVGTSLPEVATTVVAALRRHSGIAVGGIVGSNIYNIGLILGATGLVAPLEAERSVVTGEVAQMVLFAVALLLPAMTGRMGRPMGALFLIGYVAFIGATVVG